MERSVLSRNGISTLFIALLLTTSASAEERTVINVANVEELYAAVNNPEYIGAIVVLAPGTYTLTLNDANHRARPNAGRVVLQSGMTLIGQNRYEDFDRDGIWDPRDDNKDGIPDTDPLRGLIFADRDTETIIDAVNLAEGPGAVRLGLDSRVEKVTVRNSTRINAAIDVNVAPAIGGLRAEVRDCVAEDGQRGIRLLIFKHDGIESSAVLERNILRRNTGSFGFGVQVAVQLSSQSWWDVILRNNLIYANRIGLFVVGEGSTDAKSYVLSTGNLYRQNELGMNIHAGRDAFAVGQPVGGNASHMHFTSIEDRIVGNKGTSGSGGVGGGVVAIAGLVTDKGATPSSDNDLNLKFIGTRWRGNVQDTRRQDLQVYGSLALGGMPGTNNQTHVLIRDATSDGGPEAFRFTASQPNDPNNRDAVIVMGMEVRFIHTVN
jgi:hypothetical protein